ncbi:hypothetical protein T552_00032 [Pneumocystis carinii B80]|uniref:Uncharacterized protein n=1 Tax=Pneumocystis carinii (strain B80) TaxID=1408658 RepID=A0A0W4ZSM7_PNEC8|nr:hypothetical protein T552_00032 [Pneumocystis carinii B80]KTW31387.1 hypothetical protein T552_00032 [Pneumocystis carinii B80]
MHEDKENIIVRVAQTPVTTGEISEKTGYISNLQKQDVGFSTASFVTPLGPRQILGGKDTNVKNMPISVLGEKSKLLNTNWPIKNKCLYTTSAKKTENKSIHKSLHEKNTIVNPFKQNESILIENHEKVVDPEYMPPKPKCTLEENIPGFSPVDLSTLQLWPLYKSYFNRLDDQGHCELEKSSQAILGDSSWKLINFSTHPSDTSTKKKNKSTTKLYGYQKPTLSFQQKSNTNLLSNSTQKPHFSLLQKQFDLSLNDFGLTQNHINPIHDPLLSDNPLFSDDPFPFEF